ncbi:hypothetical protein [Methylobacter sp.]|uniref:hypothetical protein n=1 Tax=Methylobacter sp. TaxID=2051955 RepID=UPI003DA38163
MRSTATLVLVTFTLMILQPTIAAAQAAKHAKPTPTPDHSAETQLSRTLQQIEDKLQKHRSAMNSSGCGKRSGNSMPRPGKTLHRSSSTSRIIIWTRSSWNAIRPWSTTTNRNCKA